MKESATINSACHFLTESENVMKKNYFINSGHRTHHLLPSLLSSIIISFILTGCVDFHHKVPHDRTVPADKVIPNKRNQSGNIKPESTFPDQKNASQAILLKRCEGELKALKAVSPDDYRRQTILFAKLMTSASQYANVRAQTDQQTAAAVDALYQYRTSRLCADISWRLLTALSNRGEGHE